MINSENIKEVFAPSNFEARTYQAEFLNDEHRFKIAIWHRRAGKSKSALCQQIRRAFLKRGIYYYFLPSYRQAKTVIWDSLIKKHVPPEVIEKINSSELAIYYKNGSIQRFAGCESIDSHRGINPIDVVFDEYAQIDEEMWTGIVQPVLRQNNGTATFIYTPHGLNHAWVLLNKAKQNPTEWFISVRTVDDTQAISAKELEEARKSTPQMLYEQEYLCKFNDNAGAMFRRIDENVYKGHRSYIPKHAYRIGVDLAKYSDFTVITVLDLMTMEVVHIDRFNQIDWNLQKARIESTAFKYNNAEVVIDCTGVGDPMVEDLERSGLNIMPFMFKEKSKKDLLNNLAMMLEQDNIKIPDDEELKDELRSMRYEMSETGNKLKIVCPRGLHDDMVMSLALSCWEAEKIDYDKNVLNIMMPEDGEITPIDNFNLHSAI